MSYHWPPPPSSLRIFKEPIRNFTTKLKSQFPFPEVLFPLRRNLPSHLGDRKIILLRVFRVFQFTLHEIHQVQRSFIHHNVRNCRVLKAGVLPSSNTASETEQPFD